MTRPSPLKVVQASPPNAEAYLSALKSRRTSTERFFVRTHFPVPKISAASWRLTVAGEVDQPRTWSYAELTRFPSVRLAATLECAGNSRTAFPIPAKDEVRWGDGAVGTAVWEGVSLRSLLRDAQVRPGASEVVFTGADAGPLGPQARTSRFSRSLHVGLATGGEDILVATRMNGAPLSREHGYPARLIVPGWYGMAWVKWLSKVVVRKSDFRGYFQASKYVYRVSNGGRQTVEPVTQMRVKSLVVTPADGGSASVGLACTIAGKAWSGAGPIAKVEVDTGDGWAPARLLPSEGRYAWSPWEFPWAPNRKGVTTIRSRATDATGASQPEEPFENELQYGSNAVRPVTVMVS